MVVMTAKLSRKKLLVAAVAALLIVVLVFCLRNPGQAPDGETQVQSRTAFLSSFGYSVDGESEQVQTVRIPTEPSEVFDRYNELQKSQGYDLSALSGKNVTRYVYRLEDCGEGEWYATVLEYRGKIVGGDVSDSAPGGRMHGFAKPA